jgi:tetratricopeptide (TPR) repeat protein
MKGSISKGNAMVLNYLNSNNEFSNVCKNEALLIYPYLVLNFEGNRKKAIDFIESTNYNFKRNHIHAYMATNIYLSNQQAKKSLDIANGIELNDAYLKMPFWNYEKGFAHLNQLNLEKSHQELTMFVNEFKGNFYIKDAYEKLSWIAYLQNDLKAAAIYRNKVINTGNTITDADKLANDNAKSGKWPNSLLLKARLLSDGGLQNQSLGILQGKTMRDFPIDEEKAEFVYRLARIHDLMGSKEQAVKFYKTAIEVGRHLKGYYASRSALQIGLIYEERKEYGNAIVYYTTCLNMKNIAFKNSLDQKAKSGLLRCEKLN